MQPRILTIELRADGFDLKQVWRDAHHAIYAQSKDGRTITWEVFAIRIKKTYNGLVVEHYPGNEDFGRYAYSCSTWERAQVRLTQLKERHRRAIARATQAAKPVDVAENKPEPCQGSGMGQ